MHELIEQSLLSGDNTLAKYKLHTLKGLSATLGAEDLSEITSTLEHAVLSDQNDFTQELNNFKDEFHRVLTALKSLPIIQKSLESTSKEHTSPAGQMTTSEMFDLMQPLKPLLKLGSPKANELLKEITAELDDTEKAELKDITEFVENYEYDEALQALDSLESD